MSDTPKIRCHIFSGAVKHVSKKNLPLLTQLWSPERGVYSTVIPGALCEIWLHGARSFHVTDDNLIEVATHANNPAQVKQPWLRLIPVWRDTAQGKVLSGILDERGGKVKFSFVCNLVPQPETGLEGDKARAAGLYAKAMELLGSIG